MDYAEMTPRRRQRRDFGLESWVSGILIILQWTIIGGTTRDTFVVFEDTHVKVGAWKIGWGHWVNNRQKKRIGFIPLSHAFQHLVFPPWNGTSFRQLERSVAGEMRWQHKVGTWGRPYSGRNRKMVQHIKQTQGSKDHNTRMQLETNQRSFCWQSCGEHVIDDVQTVTVLTVQEIYIGMIVRGIAIAEIPIPFFPVLKWT